MLEVSRPSIMAVGLVARMSVMTMPVRLYRLTMLFSMVSEMPSPLLLAITSVTLPCVDSLTAICSRPLESAYR